ncbi:MAG: T9SS type A sorting domain-containing protein [Saprospiraceae bacterium]
MIKQILSVKKPFECPPKRGKYFLMRLLLLFAVLALWSVEVLAQDTTMSWVLREMKQDDINELWTGVRLSNQQSVNREKHYYINELWTPQGWLYNVFNGTRESVLNPFTDKNPITLFSTVKAEHTVQLVNALGATVWIRKITDTEDENVLTINDLQALPLGIYALRVLVPNGQIYTYKLLKQ